MMTYTVEVSEVHKAIYEIESDQPLSRAELLKRTHALIEDGSEEIAAEYSYTLDDDVWNTRTKGGDFVL